LHIIFLSATLLSRTKVDAECRMLVIHDINFGSNPKAWHIAITINFLKCLIKVENNYETFRPMTNVKVLKSPNETVMYSCSFNKSVLILVKHGMISFLNYVVQ
jgi:hypothetical protein